MLSISGLSLWLRNCLNSSGRRLFYQRVGGSSIAGITGLGKVGPQLTRLCPFPLSRALQNGDPCLQLHQSFVQQLLRNHLVKDHHSQITFPDEANIRVNTRAIALAESSVKVYNGVAASSLEANVVDFKRQRQHEFKRTTGLDERTSRIFPSTGSA